MTSTPENFEARDVQRHPVGRARGPLDAVVIVPGSKSIANRALICATLAHGSSVLINVPSGDDTEAMIDCVSRLGAEVSRRAGADATLTIVGTGGALTAGPLALHTRLAGTTSRFVTALCALGLGRYEIDGFDPLRARPMAPLHQALADLGVGVHPTREPGHLPVSIDAVDRIAGSPRGAVLVRGDISSQYISALMLIAPYLPGGLRIELLTSLVSRSYVLITAAVMAAFGVGDVSIDDHSINVAPGAYAACRYAIEPDASSASYPLAAAAICGGAVRVVGLGSPSLQGDAAFADVLASMGCGVTRDGQSTMVSRDGDLRGITIDMSDLSDLVPTLAVVAPFASTATEITGVGFIRSKESDRLGDLAFELRRCGIDAVEMDDGLVVHPGFGEGAALATHHDHRLAMAFGVLGLALGGVEVIEPEVVSKSWPDFWSALESIRATS